MGCTLILNIFTKHFFIYISNLNLKRKTCHSLPAMEFVSFQIEPPRNESYAFSEKIGEKEMTLPFTIRRNKLPKNRPYIKPGHWTLREKVRFSIFLEYFDKLFSLKENRKTLKIYRMMETFLKTKNADQCRSFHQKIKSRFHKIASFFDSMREEYGEELYERDSQLFRNELEAYETLDEIEVQEEVRLLKKNGI